MSKDTGKQAPAIHHGRRPELWPPDVTADATALALYRAFRADPDAFLAVEAKA